MQRAVSALSSLQHEMRRCAAPTMPRARCVDWMGCVRVKTPEQALQHSCFALLCNTLEVRTALQITEHLSWSVRISSIYTELPPAVAPVTV